MRKNDTRGACTGRRAGAEPRAGAFGIGAGHLLVSAVILPIVLVLAGAGWLVWQSGRIAEATAFTRQSERVVDEANQLQELLLDQQRAIRGFLITGEASFLVPYERAHPHEALDALEQHVEGNAPQIDIVRRIRAEYLLWEDATVRSLAAPALGRQLTEMQRREAVMNRMQALIDEFLRLQDERRDANYARVARETRIAEWSAIVLLVLLGGGAAAVSLRQIRVIAASVALERAALRAKDELLATLSHELRTPLTAILGWATLARKGRVTGATLERALASIERNAQIEAQLVDDVLDTARINAGKLKLAADLVDPGAVACEAAEVVRLSAEARGILLEVSVDPGTPEVIGDAPRLQQVVWNLLSNAVKFTPSGRHVRLSVAPSGSKVVIRVADEGEGIAKEKLPHVFDRFWQADSSPTRRHGGLGLGLAIVKEIAALHGGEVQVASEGLGRGAVFTVTLPSASERRGAAA
jgi:signal transduction histidine kinase